MIKGYIHIDWKHYKALLYKELCDLPKNGQVIINFVAVIALVLAFSFLPRENVPQSFLLAFIFSMLTMLMQGNLVVEEKEQQTTRRLRQLSFTLKEMILPKMTLTFLTTMFVFFVFCLLYGSGAILNLKLFLLVFPFITIMLVVGTFLGMAVKNTIEVNLYAIPTILFYFFTEGLLMNSHKGEISWLKILPNYYLYHGIKQLHLSSQLFYNLIVPVFWAIIITVSFITWCKKKYLNERPLDNK